MSKQVVCALLGALSVTHGGCVSSQTRSGYDRVLRESAEVGSPPRDPKPLDSKADHELASSVRRQTILQLVLARNPELGTMGARVRASAERGRSLGRLPDAQLKYEQGGVPLDRPYALHDAEMLTLGVEQMFPAPGSLDAQSRAALHETLMAVQEQRSTRQALLSRAEQAYASYARLHEARALRGEHVELATRVVELAGSLYAGNQGNQRGLLQASVELSRLRRELARSEQELRASAALLNALMARAADAPLGPPEPLPTELDDVNEAELERRMLKERPELLRDEHAIARSKATLDAARREADLPSFAVGAAYWLAPHMEQPHAYGAMVSMSLPWLNARHDEEVRAAEQSLLADRNARESARHVAGYELRAAVAGYRAARAELAILESDLLEQARKNAEAVQSAFGVGGVSAAEVLDALRVLLEVRLERAELLASAHAALAEVRRAAGTDSALGVEQGAAR
jgi:outer membrane protein TolC